MSKRFIIWLVIAVTTGGLVVAFCLLRNRDSSGVVFNRQSGDLADFFLKQAVAYGAHPKTNSRIEQLDSSWECSTDPDGFQIFLPPTDTERLVRAIAPAFGEPERRDSYPHILYMITNVGVHISIGTNMAWTTNHHLICIRGDSMMRSLGVKP